MTGEQIWILAILVATVAMFLWGRWRHDMVAVAALLASVFAGLVPAADAFAGFGHPAVVTVACVLVLSRGLQTSGAIDVLAQRVLPANAGPTLSIAMLTALGAVLSAFMNNVGALALLMPVAVQLSTRLEIPAGKVLMPLAFGSILGGTTTMIGTPPNLIVAGFRNSAELGSFTMFSFTPVGAAITVVGVLFIALIGWRLVPSRPHAGVGGFEAGAYLTEARAPEDAKAVGMSLRAIQSVLDENDAQLLGLVRNEVRVIAPHRGRVVLADDILIIEAEAESLTKALTSLGLHLEEATRDKPRAAEEEVPLDDPESPPDATPDAEAHVLHEESEKNEKVEEIEKAEKTEDTEEIEEIEADAPATAEKPPASDDIVLMELAVLPASSLVDRSAQDALLRTRYGINLLAVSRQGMNPMTRLRALTLEAGDLLLVQGAPESILEFAGSAGCVPLATRDLRIPDRRKAVYASGIMLVAVTVAAAGVVPIAVAFIAGVLASMALRTVPARAAYEAVDWSVVVLLAALLPVAGAMQSTGTADLLARGLLEQFARGNPVIGVVVILVTTMVLTDLMNNAATAAVMAPVALGAAVQLGVNPDTFLMSVAVGSSCAFLTPIGHQNNTLILGPGGFRFGDYWKMGLPLDLIVIAVSIPMLLWVWPL